MARSTSSEPRSWDARSQVRGVFRGPSTGEACPFLARALAQRLGRERVDELLAVGGIDGGVHERFYVRVIASPRRIHDARDAGDFARIVEPAHSIAQQALVDPEEYCDWIAEFEQSRAQGEPSLRLRKIGPAGQMRRRKRARPRGGKYISIANAQ